MTTGPMAVDPDRIRALHDALLADFGPQHWWPGRSAFEVMAGAILVQRTRWGNAALALDNLAGKGLLRPEKLAACRLQDLEILVRPAGFYRQKACRLRVAATWWTEQGGLRRLGRRSTAALRSRLLELEGIGPETADSILLYVFHRPVFVADAYARRLFRRLGWITHDDRSDYESVARAVNSVTMQGAGFFNELHALIVAHAKSVCAGAPRCGECPVSASCAFAAARGKSTERRCSGR